MGFMKKAKAVVGTFTGRETTQEKTPTEIKREVAKIRASSENLKNKLLTVRFKDTTGKISPDKMKHYLNVLTALTITLDKTPAYELDTSTLDKQMEELVAIFAESIREGHEKTADYVLKALLYGIGKGHATMTTTDKDKIEQQMQERIERLEKYCTIVSLSQKVDRCHSQMEKAGEKYKETSKLYKEKRAALDKEEKENPYIFERAREVRGRNETRDPEEMELVARIREVDGLYKEAKQLKQQRTTNQATIQSLENQIHTEENMLMMQSLTLEEELIKKIEQDIVDFRERMSDAWDQIYKLGELSDQTAYALDAIFSSAQIDGYVIDTISRYDQIKREEQRKEDGRRLALERAQENEEENEEENILLN